VELTGPGSHSGVQRPTVSAVPHAEWIDGLFGVLRQKQDSLRVPFAKKVEIAGAQLSPLGRRHFGKD